MNYGLTDRLLAGDDITYYVLWSS